MCLYEAEPADERGQQLQVHPWLSNDIDLVPAYFDIGLSTLSLLL
jgi:hypothetical protein